MGFSDGLLICCVGLRLDFLLPRVGVICIYCFWCLGVFWVLFGVVCFTFWFWVGGTLKLGVGFAVWAVCLGFDLGVYRTCALNLFNLCFVLNLCVAVLDCRLVVCLLWWLFDLCGY